MLPNLFLSKNEKKHKHKHKHQQSNNPLCYVDSLLQEVELPGNCYVGGCELLVGTLLCILPISGSAAVGFVVMGDGIRRVVDGIVQLSDERRADPNFIPPQPPFNQEG